jgi:uncharacterized protein (DUF1330 family)
MPNAYWITTYRSISDPAKLAAYAELSGPAVTAAGGTILARGVAQRTFELGQLERTVLIQFDSVEAAAAAYDSPAYQEALRALGDGAERDIRIVEGV